jgi:preprotein translocase subunit Sss1
MNIEGLAIMFGIAILGGIGFLIAFKIQEIQERKRHSH